jgi:ribosome-associated translation inhibitor RaiA
MSDETAVAIHFNLEVEEELKEELENRSRALFTEFPELTHVEITLSADGDGCLATGHVTGKSTELASHANADEPSHAADRLIDTLKQQLRRTHDKRIFAHRREAQKSHPRRG